MLNKKKTKQKDYYKTYKDYYKNVLIHIKIIHTIIHRPNKQYIFSKHFIIILYYIKLLHYNNWVN